MTTVIPEAPGALAPFTTLCPRRPRMQVLTTAPSLVHRCARSIHNALPEETSHASAHHGALSCPQVRSRVATLCPRRPGRHRSLVAWSTSPGSCPSRCARSARSRVLQHTSAHHGASLFPTGAHDRRGRTHRHLCHALCRRGRFTEAGASRGALMTSDDVR